MRISEEQELEKVMLEDKMKMTDWEATNEAIEEQIARESYVQWLRDNERRVSKTKKMKFTATATVTTTSISSTSSGSASNDEPIKNSPKLSPKQPSPRLSPKAGSSGTNSSSPLCDPYGIVETSSFVNQFPPQMFGKRLAIFFCNNNLMKRRRFYHLLSYELC
jgi:OTU domain-containing protein 5